MGLRAWWLRRKAEKALRAEIEQLQQAFVEEEERRLQQGTPVNHPDGSVSFVSAKLPDQERWSSIHEPTLRAATATGRLRRSEPEIQNIKPLPHEDDDSTLLTAVAVAAVLSDWDSSNPDIDSDTPDTGSDDFDGGGGDFGGGGASGEW